MFKNFVHTEDKETVKDISKDCVFYYNKKYCIIIRRKDIARAIAATPPDINATIAIFDGYGNYIKTIATTFGNLINQADQDWLNANRCDLIAYQEGEKEIGTIDYILLNQRIISKEELDG